MMRRKMQNASPEDLITLPEAPAVFNVMLVEEETDAEGKRDEYSIA
jgi:hypothetical protein